MSQDPPQPERESVLLLVCSNGKEPEAVRRVVLAFEKSDWIRCRSSSDWQKASLALKGGGVLVAVIQTKEDLLEFTRCITALGGEIREGRAQAIALSKLDHPKIVRIMINRGVADILPLEPPVKSLFHKVEKLLQNVDRKRREVTERAKNVIEGKTASKRADEHVNRLTIVKKPSLESAEDFWRIDFKKEIKSVMGRWLLEILGPSPATGTWEASNPPPEAVKLREQAWKWVPRPKLKEAENPFRTEGGNWVFFGSKPTASWERNRWGFVSRSPTLAFFSGEVLKSYRFKPEEKNTFAITDNSPSTTKGVDALLATWSADFKAISEQRVAAEDEAIEKDEPGEDETADDVQREEADTEDAWNDFRGEDKSDVLDSDSTLRPGEKTERARGKGARARAESEEQEESGKPSELASTAKRAGLPGSRVDKDVDEEGDLRVDGDKAAPNRALAASSDPAAKGEPAGGKDPKSAAEAKEKKKAERVAAASGKPLVAKARGKGDEDDEDDGELESDAGAAGTWRDLTTKDRNKTKGKGGPPGETASEGRELGLQKRTEAGDEAEDASQDDGEPGEGGALRGKGQGGAAGRKSRAGSADPDRPDRPDKVFPKDSSQGRAGAELEDEEEAEGVPGTSRRAGAAGAASRKGGKARRELEDEDSSERDSGHAPSGPSKTRSAQAKASGAEARKRNSEKDSPDDPAASSIESLLNDAKPSSNWKSGADAFLTMSLKAWMRAKGEGTSEEVVAEVIDGGNRTLLVWVQSSWTQGEAVTLKLSWTSVAHRLVTLEVSGCVLRSEADLLNDGQLVELEIDNDCRLKMRAILANYQSRQAEILGFFRAARGR